MNKTLVFDMDGTIADLYGVSEWLPKLRAFDATPYRDAEPMYDMVEMRSVLLELKRDGWRIVITSWLSKDSNRIFDSEVRYEKIEWLRKYDFPYDECHIVRYGATKMDSTRKLGGRQILFDDNENVRKGWSGESVDASAENILESLKKLLDEQ